MRSAEGTTQQNPNGAAAQQPKPDGAAAEDADRSPAEPSRIGFIGKTLGRFHINSELGRGGMATVYRAHDPQLGRDVAVKVMHGFFAGRAEIEARFRREATAVAAIRHPSILALYDFAPPDGEEPGYIVSELIEGPGLRQVVDQRGGRLSPEVSMLIAIRVAEALGAAHAAGIVHRDVKPDNVLIDRAGVNARVVLTDFGVAHVSGMDTMTVTGAVLGSPAYMSPEQARGADVGPTSDVFSLGVLLYQLCTGHVPFGGKDPLMVIAALLRGEYLRAGKIEARVGPELEQIIARCLQPVPSARFPDGNAVAAALRDNLTATAATDSDEEGALRRYLVDPDAFEREAAPKVAAAALGAADRARRRGQHPRALAEIGRALAYAPDDAAAHALLARIGSRPRRRWIGVGVVCAAAVGAIAIALLGLPRMRVPASPVAANAVATSPRAAGAEVQNSAIPLPAAPGVAAARAAETAAAARVTKTGTTPASTTPTIAPLPQRRGSHSGNASMRDKTPRTPASSGSSASPASSGSRVSSGSPTSPAPPASDPATAVVAVAPGPPSNPTAPESAAPGAPVADRDPSARAAADPPTTGRIVLRASKGFCEPSLDAHPPSLRATYDNLAAGPHEIFCTFPQGGEKVRVSTYVLRPGTRPSLIIVRGADGRPTMGRPAE